MIKKVTVKHLVPVALVVMVAGGAISLALAQDDNSKPEKAHQPAMVVEINKNGKILLRGIVDSVSGDTLSLKSWGGNWTVKISSTTEGLPKSSTSTLERFKQGDFVGVIGQVSETENWTVSAKTVRNWTERRVLKEEKREMKKEERQAKKEEAKIYVGTVGDLGTNSFTLNKDDKNFTVHVSTGTKILNRNWLKIDFSDIQAGDRVRTLGTASGTDIGAQVVRDISLPK